MTTVTRRPARRAPLSPHSATFHAFADMLYAGVLIFGLSLLVVTWFAALSAGVEALRTARRDDTHVSARTVAAAFADRVVRHPLSHVVAPTLVTAVLVVDVIVLPYVAPGSLWSIVLPVVLAAALGAIALRVAGAWRRESAPRDSLALAWRRMSTDGAGSALLFLAVVTAGAIVTIVPMLAVVIPGPLALAAVAMDRTTEVVP